MKDNYFIKSGYQARSEVPHFNDTANKDEWQKEVYLKARKMLGNSGILIDYGCGSGYKLEVFFNGLKIFKLGAEVEPTLSWLRRNRPDGEWLSPEEAQVFAEASPPDMVICADVIEHIADPDVLLESLKALQASTYIISTPERDLVRGLMDMGPPANPFHVREWNKEEFLAYLADRGFIVSEAVVLGHHTLTVVGSWKS